MAASGSHRDPRSFVTPDAFEVSGDLLGTPLATPGKRLVALLVDLLVIGFVTLVALMLTFAEEPLQKVDNRLYEAMGAGPDIDKWGPEWLEVVGNSPGSGR